MVSEREHVAQVFFASVHLEHTDFYPDHSMGVEGSVSHVHNMVSVPLKHGTKSKDFRDIVASRLLPRLADFKPDLILVSAGFDGHKDDVLGNGGGVQLVEDDYAWITRQLVHVADTFSQVPRCLLP